MKQAIKKMWSLPAMARRINVRPADLRAEAEAGTLPSIRVGASRLFDPEAVEMVLLARARQQAQPAPVGKGAGR